MKRALLRGAALLLLLIVLGCSGRDSADVVLVRVGDRDVTLGEFQRAFDEIVALGEGYKADSLSARRFLSDYIDKTLLEQMAADSIPWIPMLNHRAVSYLESMMVHKQRRDAYGHVGEISEKELRDVYEKGRVWYHYGAIPYATRQEALQAMLNIREGAAFSKLADHVLGQSGGGDQGWRSVIDVPESIIDKLAELAPGEVGGPVETQGSHCIVRLIEKEANPNLAPFETVKSGLRILVIQDRGGRLIRSFHSELLSKYRYEPRMAEIVWMTEFLRDETKDVKREYNPKLKDTGIGMPVAEPSDDYSPPWTECPLNDEERERILSTTTVDTVTAVLFLDHLLTKLVFTWPLFEEPQDVIKLLRELVISRLERFEAWERGYDQDPDLKWKAQKRRNLIHTRQFVRGIIRARVKPTNEEARAWYAREMAPSGQPDRRRYIMILVRSREAAERARQVLASVKDPEGAFASVKALDPTATWIGSDGFTVTEGRISSAIDRQVLRLKVGEVTEPTPVGLQYGVARLEEIHTSVRRPFEDIAKEIVEQLTSIRTDSLLNVYLLDRRAITPISVDESVFERIRYDETGQAR